MGSAAAAIEVQQEPARCNARAFDEHHHLRMFGGIDVPSVEGFA
jgi:hypothetical protein